MSLLLHGKRPFRQKSLCAPSIEQDIRRGNKWQVASNARGVDRPTQDYKSNALELARSGSSDIARRLQLHGNDLGLFDASASILQNDRHALAPTAWIRTVWHSRPLRTTDTRRSRVCRARTLRKKSKLAKSWPGAGVCSIRWLCTNSPWTPQLHLL